MPEGKFDIGEWLKDLVNRLAAILALRKMKYTVEVEDPNE